MGGPEEFFEYMRGQGMSPEEIQRMLSGDVKVMEEAVSRKIGSIDDDTMSALNRANEVANQVDHIIHEKKQSECTPFERDRRPGGLPLGNIRSAVSQLSGGY